MGAIVVVLILIALGVAFSAFALWLRFMHLRPSVVSFADSGSAELWHKLAKGQPVLVFPDSPIVAAREQLSKCRETLKADAPRVFAHFFCDERTTIPVIRLHEAGPGYLMEVAYKGKLAKVILAVLGGLRPLCAISVGHRQPGDAWTMWLLLICRLDGPPWFVLCSLMRNKSRVQRLYDPSESVEVHWEEHART